jgi:diaminopimelate epimerase
LCFDDNDLITVNMGIPQHQPAQVPLLAEQEALVYRVVINGQQHEFGAVSMGNPHAVIHVANTKAAPVAKLGKALESHPLFPERANIGFMQVVNPHSIKLRVYERGAAETLACGSGACAAVVIGIEQKLLNSPVVVKLAGGTLKISWAGRGEPVWMTGAAVSVFDGVIVL